MQQTIIYEGNLKETLKEAGYIYIRPLGNKEHLLKDNQSNVLEVWVANKNHASYGIKFKNTDLEFCHSVKGINHAI